MAYPRYVQIFLYVYSTILIRFPHTHRRDILEEYHYIVVGAGSAGATLASRLSEDPNVKVLLLEAGGVPSQISKIPLLADYQWNSTYSWNYETVPQEKSCLGYPNKSCFWPRGKLLGGTSEINGMLYVRGNKADYDEWEKLGITGWNYDDVLPYFLKSEDMTLADGGIIEKNYHSHGGPLTVSEAEYKTPFFEPFMKAARDMGYAQVDYNGDSQLGFAHPQITTRRGERCGTFLAYLMPARRRRNLHILTNAIATKIVFDADKTAKAVEYSLNGERRKASASKEIILSAGAIASPQLLLLSGVGPKEDLKKLNIDVIQDLPVGRNLQDHIGSFAFTFVTNVSKTLQWEYAVRPRTVNQYLRQKKGPLTVPCAIDAIGFLRTKYAQNESSVPDTQFYLIAHDFAEEVPVDYIGPHKNDHMITLMSTPLQPKSVGTVSLRSNNPSDPPLIDPRHLTHPEDMDVMIAGMRMLLNMALSDPMKPLGLRLLNPIMPACEKYTKWSDDYLACAARQLTFTTSHNVGTCRMGALNDSNTVVDSQLRVKGLKNLRVADASIIPKIISGNTNAPSIMIGEKAADLIRGKTIIKNT